MCTAPTLKFYGGLVIFIHVCHLYLYHMLFNSYNAAFYCYLILITFSIDFSIVL